MKAIFLSFLLFTFSFAAFAQPTLTATPGTCNGSNNLYNLTGTITGTLPTTGQIVISVAGEGIRIYELPFTSPLNYTVTGLNSDGATKTVGVTFTNGLGSTPATYTATYTAPFACLTNTCADGTPGEESYTFNVSLQTTDFFDYPLTLPKFNTNGDTRILQKVLLSAKNTLLANAIAENQSTTAVNLNIFSETNTSEIDQNGNTIFALPDLKYTYKNISLGGAVILNGPHGGYPGDISSSTLLGMAALNPSPIQDVIDFINPRTNPNWVTTLTGDVNDADDIVYFPPTYSYSTNNNVYTSSLSDFTGTGDLGYTYTTVGGFSFSGGGGNFQFKIATKAAVAITITYYYCTASTVPVKLISFTANNAENNSVKLNWILSEQVNVDHYEIEQSMNGTSFNSVGRVAAGNVLNYTFNYPDAAQGLNYFRLKTADKDGKISYSDIVKVNVPVANTSVNIYPNPATSYVKVSLGNMAKNSPVTIKVVALDGRVVKEQKVNTLSTSVTLNTNNLPAGKYFIKLESGSQVITKSIEILK